MNAATLTPEKQLDQFIARYDPPVALIAKAALKKLQAFVPGATQLVYDNYNALAIGFGPTERASEIVFSIAVYPQWVSLFLMRGPKLPDPKKLLKGTGRLVRHIVLESAADLDLPAIRALMRHALAAAPKPISSSPKGPLIIKSVSKKQRPRSATEKALPAE